MRALAFDTATEDLSIALGNRQELLGEINVKAGRSHLELLLPAINDLLGNAGMTAAGLDLICVGTGPGTFSGLRVGVATARALSQSLETPLQGQSSLAALARGMADIASGNREELLLPVIDARRGQVFAQLYRTDAASVLAASGVFCEAPQDLIRKIAALTDRPVRAAGNGILSYFALFDKKPVQPLPAGDLRHQVRAVYYLPAPGLKIKYDSHDLLDVLPAYIREPDADKTVLLRKKGIWL